MTGPAGSENTVPAIQTPEPLTANQFLGRQALRNSAVLSRGCQVTTTVWMLVPEAPSRDWSPARAPSSHAVRHSTNTVRPAATVQQFFTTTSPVLEAATQAGLDAGDDSRVVNL